VIGLLIAIRLEQTVEYLPSAGTAQIFRLTPVQPDRLKEAIQSSIYDDEELLNDCRHLTSQAEEIPKGVAE
jgi:hypothetical protein